MKGPWLKKELKKMAGKKATMIVTEKEKKAYADRFVEQQSDDLKNKYRVGMTPGKREILERMAQSDTISGKVDPKKKDLDQSLKAKKVDTSTYVKGEPRGVDKRMERKYKRTKKRETRKKK